MIRVLRHGDTIAVTNPATGDEQTMINVVFIEEGRSGANAALAGSSDLLSKLVGEDVGLEQFRVHTQPILATKIQHFPVDATFPGHINRGLYSTPQMRQQIDKEARMIDGLPTYFTTWLSEKAEEDVDKRDRNPVANPMRLEPINGLSIGATNVKTIKRADVGSSGSGGSSAPAGVTGAGATVAVA